jgi:putative ABC transport system substrate-binding protein
MRALFSAIAILIFCRSLTAAAVELVIVYPQVREPFAQVFEEIVRGAEDGYEQQVQRVAMSENQSPVDFVHVLDRQSPVLVLGNRLARQVSQHNTQHKVIVGAVNGEFNQVFGISLTPSFEAISNKLSSLVPKVKKIHVITKPENTALDFDLVAGISLHKGYRVVIHEAEDIRSAAAVYRKLVETLDQDDAVWILPNGSFVNNAMLSILLQASWEKHFVVFSSNPIHVKRGALFSVYPNNYKMGLSLGRLAQTVAKDRVANRQMQPLNDVFVTLNERTSNHLGISLTDDLRANIDLVLPAR